MFSYTFIVVKLQQIPISEYKYKDFEIGTQYKYSNLVWHLFKQSIPYVV